MKSFPLFSREDSFAWGHPPFFRDTLHLVREIEEKEDRKCMSGGEKFDTVYEN